MPPNPQPAAMTEERLREIERLLGLSTNMTLNWIVRDLLAELSRLREERDKLQAIIDKLLKADGVPITPGMTVFCRYPEILRYDGAYEFEVVLGGREVHAPNDVAELGSGPWFLTREAALAATPLAGEKEKT